MPYPDVPVASAATGPLVGFRLAVKDLFDVAGYPTAAGNAALLAASGIKATTAPLVQHLLDAGASFVGKTKTDELAYSLIGDNIHFGMPLNPVYPDLIPGGSSSGSAVAVAAGLAEIGLGTDTSGSIRLPAAVNGLVGWRPTHGSLDIDGLRPLAPSFDVPGFAASSPTTIERVMDALDFPDAPKHPTSILVADEVLEACKPAIVERFEKLVTSCGHRIRSISKLSTHSLDDLRLAFTTILQSEAWQTNAEFFRVHGNTIAPDIADRLVHGSRLDKEDVTEASKMRQSFGTAIECLLGDTAVLAMPTLPLPPPARTVDPAIRTEFRARSISMFCISGLSGCPQITFPTPSDGNGPLGLSLISAKWSDRLLLSSAKLLKNRLRHSAMTPSHH